MKAIYTDLAGREIAAIKYLVPENALVLGFKHGSIAVLDLYNTEKPIEVMRPLGHAITRIVARPITKRRHFKTVQQSIVVTGDAGGNVVQFRVERSSNNTLSCKVKVTKTLSSESIHAITISAAKDFACSNTQGIYLLWEKDSYTPKNLDKNSPIALLPIIGTAAFIAISSDGTNTIFGDTSKLKRNGFATKLFQEDAFPKPVKLLDVKGIIRHNRKTNEIDNYDLVALTTDGTLLLNSNTKVKKVLAQNIALMDLVAQINRNSGYTSIVLAYMDSTGNVYYGNLHTSNLDNWASSYMKTSLTAVSAIAAKPLKSTTYLAQGSVIHEVQLLQPMDMSKLEHETSSSSSSASSAASTAPIPSGPYGDTPSTSPVPSGEIEYGALPSQASPYGKSVPASPLDGVPAPVSQPTGPYGIRIDESESYAGLPGSSPSDTTSADCIVEEDEGLEHADSYTKIGDGLF